MAERLQTILGHLKKDGKVLLQASNVSTGYVAPTGNYEYTVQAGARRLTPEQRQFYEDNGFLVIKNLVSKQKLERYRDQFEKICKREVQVPGITIMRDIAISKSEFVPDQKAVTKIQTWHEDEVLWEYCALPEIVEYVENFLGPNVVAMHTMLINKPPDPGRKSSRHPMHQDLYYFPFRPTNRIVCAWTAMEKVHRQNGCLVVLPGTHKGKLLQHDYPEWEGGVNKMYHGVRDFDPSSPRVHLEMEAGDTVFFHPLLIHGSGMNRTNGFRKAISCHYSTGDAHFVNMDGVQETIADEILELASSRTGLPKEDIKYEDIWKFRSKLVKGDCAWK